LRQTFAQQDPDPALGNRLFTTPETVNSAPTTHIRREDDCHGNGKVEESNGNVQRRTAMSGSRDGLVESHIVLLLKTTIRERKYALKRGA